MANRLKMAEIQAIQTLRLRGWSRRRIARELGIHRETVGRYVDLAESKPANPPPGSEGENQPNLPAGSDVQNQPNPMVFSTETCRAATTKVSNSCASEMCTRPGSIACG